MKRLLLFVVLCCAPVAYMACGKATVQSPAPPSSSANSLQRVSVGLLNLAKAVGDTQTSIISLHDQKLIPDDAYIAILNTCVKVSLAGKQADAVTAKLAALGPAERQNVADIFKPIAAAVRDSLDTQLIRIPNPNTQATVRASLSTMQSVIAVIQAATAAGN